MGIERKCRLAALLALPSLTIAAPARAQTCPGPSDPIYDYTTIDNRRDPGVELYVFWRWRVFGELHTDRAHGVRGRLYRNFWSMQSYHRLAVIRGRQKLKEAAEVHS